MEKLTYAASVMCARLMRLQDDIEALAKAGVDELHFDIMDGIFVPNITFGMDFVRAAKEVSSLSCFAHLMIVKPEAYVKRFRDAGADGVTVHIESTVHIQRLLTTIRQEGMKVGVAINPATPLTRLDYVLDYVDRVLVMAVDPGFAGQKLIPSAFERVQILKRTIDARKLPVEIEVDGNISATNAAHLAQRGASVFVLGTASIFNADNHAARFPEFVREVDAKRVALTAP